MVQRFHEPCNACSIASYSHLLLRVFLLVLNTGLWNKGMRMFEEINVQITNSTGTDWLKFFGVTGLYDLSLYV